MKGLYAILLATFMLTGQAVADTAPAVEIFYSLQSLGGGQYEYDYTVVNNSLVHQDTYGNNWGDEGVTMFEIYFPARQNFYSDIKTSDAVLFSGLNVTGVPDPSKWSVLPLDAQPVWHPPVDQSVWLIDALAVDAHDSSIIYPIRAEAAPVTGFSVTFNYSGSGSPGDQQFSVLDPSDYSSYFDGRTEPNPMPEPASFLLLAAGIVGVALLGEKRS